MKCKDFTYICIKKTQEKNLSKSVRPDRLLMFNYCAQTITKVALDMAAPFNGAVFLVKQRKQNPLDNSNVYSEIKYCKAGFESGK